MKKLTLLVFLFSIFAFTLTMTAQTYSGILNHTQHYLTIQPFSSSFDDGTHAKLFYDGNNRIVNFWNSSSTDGYTDIRAGNLFVQDNLFVEGGGTFDTSSFSVASASPANSYMRDAWLTGTLRAPTWNETTNKWERADYIYNDIGGIIFQDEGTYFIRVPRDQSKLEFTNQEFLDQAYIFSNIYNGNIGMGTTETGDYKLSVAGKIRAEEVKVYTGWADFVFEDNYQLPTLAEVESHIKEKGHLKDIPSALEVKENGIYLGEMNAKLLQKIEELTLYLIKQEKRIKVLENQNR